MATHPFALTRTGDPVFLGKPVGLRNLADAEEYLQALTTALRTPIGRVVRPPLFLHVFPCRKTGDGRWEWTTRPNPDGPRQSAENHVRHLYELLNRAEDSLVLASDPAAGACWDCGGGFIPPGQKDYYPDNAKFLLVPLRTDFTYHVSRAARQKQGLAEAIRERCQWLTFALALIDRYKPGCMFRCADRRLSKLVEDPEPFIERIGRDASSTLWQLIPRARE